MDTLMKPGDEVTGRIRWEQPVLTLYGYVAGETVVQTFTIWCPEPGDTSEVWVLTSALPGQHDRRLSGDQPEALRRAAEAWVAEFVHSVGAVFPPEPDESAAFRLSEAREVLADWDAWRDDPDGRIYDRERVLADQVRALLAIADEPAKEAGQ